jgi:cell division protein FtsL
MLRLNLLLALIVMFCALALVTSQHRARKLFQAIDVEQERSRALEVEFGQLQIEQSTWAVHTRIERVAIDRLHMRRPDLAGTLRPGVDLAPPTKPGAR